MQMGGKGVGERSCRLGLVKIAEELLTATGESLEKRFPIIPPGDGPYSGDVSGHKRRRQT